MVDVDKLRGVIAERGMSQRKVAERLGITDKTFYSKMKTGLFNSAEMAEMITFLNIEKPAEIFFANIVSQQETSVKEDKMDHKLTVTINQTELPVKEYQGQRVVTMKEIDAVHQRPEGTAPRNFNTNKHRFIEGVDYFVRTASEAAEELGQ